MSSVVSEHTSTNNNKTTDSKTSSIITNNKKKNSQSKTTTTIDQILHLQRTIGNQAVNRLIQNGTIQPKLSISHPADSAEIEADRTADRVMSMPSAAPIQAKSQEISRQPEEEDEELQGKLMRESIPEEEELQTKIMRKQDLGIDRDYFFKPVYPLEKGGGGIFNNNLMRVPDEDMQTKLMRTLDPIRRDYFFKPAYSPEKGGGITQGNLMRAPENEDEELLQGKIMRESIPEEEELQTKVMRAPEDEEELLQGKYNSTTDTNHLNRLESQINSAKSSGGSPMDNPTKQFMESRFGNDFSGVKIHTDSNASQLNREVNARAFTFCMTKN